MHSLDLDNLTKNELLDLVRTLEHRLEQSEAAMVSTTVDGTGPSWNQAAERLFGYGAAEMVGRSIDPLLPPEMADQEKTPIRPRIMACEQVDSRESVRLQLLSAIVGSTDDAVMSWYADGTLLTWNEGAQAMLGYSAEEILGNSVSVLMPPGDADWQELTRAVAAGEKVLNQGTVRRHRNGTMIQVAVTCSSLRD